MPETILNALQKNGLSGHWKSIDLTFRQRHSIFDAEHRRYLQVAEDDTSQGQGFDDATILAKWADNVPPLYLISSVHEAYALAEDIDMAPAAEAYFQRVQARHLQ